MIIYNPQNEPLIKERIIEAERLLAEIPAKYCFITGSFLYKQKYNDIDIFVVSRSQKKMKISNTKATITRIDFNNLHSLFYHSISKSCMAKNILPTKTLKATLSDYWQVVNEAVPTLINQKNAFHKNVRFLVLYTEYFKTGEIMDTFQLNKKINSFRDCTSVLNYIEETVPKAIRKNRKKTYLKRFFYTQAGHYKKISGYSAQEVLYKLALSITRGLSRG